jgi:hypothetical protein
MKTLLAWIAVTLLALSFPGSPAYAQWTPVTSPTPNEAIAIPSGAGPQVGGSAVVKYGWNTTYTAKLTVTGLVSDSDITFGSCTLYEDGTFNCYENEHGTGRNYGGTYTLIGKKKNKVQFTFGQSSVQEYKSVLTDWVEALAAEDGATLSNISFDFTTFKIPKATIPTTATQTGSVTLTIKGKVSATLDGVYTTKKFSYTSKISY